MSKQLYARSLELIIKDVPLIYGHPKFQLEYWGIDEEGTTLLPEENYTSGGKLLFDPSLDDPYNPPKESFFGVKNPRGEGKRLTGDIVFQCCNSSQHDELADFIRELKEGRLLYLSPRYVGRLNWEGDVEHRRLVCWDVIPEPIARPLNNDGLKFVVSLETHTPLNDLVTIKDLEDLKSQYLQAKGRLNELYQQLTVK